MCSAYYHRKLACLVGGSIKSILVDCVERRTDPSFEYGQKQDTAIALTMIEMNMRVAPKGGSGQRLLMPQCIHFNPRTGFQNYQGEGKARMSARFYERGSHE